MRIHVLPGERYFVVTATAVLLLIALLLYSFFDDGAYLYATLIMPLAIVGYACFAPPFHQSPDVRFHVGHALLVPIQLFALHYWLTFSFELLEWMFLSGDNPGPLEDDVSAAAFFCAAFATTFTAVRIATGRASRAYAATMSAATLFAGILACAALGRADRYWESTIESLRNWII